MLMVCVWRKFLSILFVLIVGVPAFAQTFRGTISGTVVDSQGAGISDAAVQLTNPATGQSFNAKSSKEGDFNFPELSVGIYPLTVSISGVQTNKIANINVARAQGQNIKAQLNDTAE